MTKRTHIKMLWALLAAAALVRIVFFIQAKNLDVFSVPILDCRTYDQWALRLVAGNWDWNETYWMGPLYPHLLAIGYRFFGSGHQVVMAVQLALSLLNIWLVYRVGQSLLTIDNVKNDKFSRADSIALLAAFLYSLYGAPVFYAGLKLMSVVVTTIMLLITMQAARLSRQMTVRNWFFLGLLIGLGALARGNFLILLAGFPLLIWQRGTPLVNRRHFLWVLSLWLGAAVMVAPATLRNIIVGNDFVLLTSNGGVNLLIGQQTSYKGTFAPASSKLEAENDSTMALELENEAGHALKGSEISRILTRRAWHTFQSQIGAMPLHYARKAFRFWNGYELPQIASYDHWRNQIPALKPLALPFMVFSALGLLGLMFISRVAGPRAKSILLIILLGYFLSLMPFFPTARYRQPLVPLLAISAAVYLFNLARLAEESVSDNSRTRVFSNLAVGCFMVLLMHPIWTALDPALVKWQVAMNASLRAARLGHLDQVLEQGKLAEEEMPGLAWTSFSLAANLEEMEVWDEALAFYEKAAIIRPDHRIIPYRIGRNRENAQQYVAALKSFSQAAALDETWAYPYLRTSLILGKLGKKDQALAAIKKAVNLAPGHYRIRSNYGSLLAETGDYSEAKKVLQTLTEDFPEYVNGWFNLAMVEMQMGQVQKARRSLRMAESIPGLQETEQGQIDKLRAVLQR